MSVVRYHKRSQCTVPPLISIILLDWSVREHFQALEWLSTQNVSRDSYELIWIDLYERVVPEAMEKADVVITLGQHGTYHKHVAYNVGLLEARGKILTICDSDAIFPPNFIESIATFFKTEKDDQLKPGVLMHYEWRTNSVYPAELNDLSELSNYKWLELWPNVGACMSVRKEDAIRFGGFDEHSSYRGYLCGPYDLGWRMVNAGIPETWHEKNVALWHFAHPDPQAAQVKSFLWRRWREITHPHIDAHALKAVEAFSTGRLLPIKENPEVHRLRMRCRKIGSSFEKKYSSLTSQAGFSIHQRVKLYIQFGLEPLIHLMAAIAQRFPHIAPLIQKTGRTILHFLQIR